MARFSMGLMTGAALAGLSLSGCATATQAEPTAAIQAPPEAPPEAPMPAENTELKIAKDNFEFSYGWPKQASAYPKLVDYFHTDAAQMEAELQASFDEDERLKDPSEEYKPTYASETTWAFAAETPQLISLSGNWYQYLGGAHGMYGVRALVFDKVQNEIVLAQDMLMDSDAFVGATQDEFCRLLDGEREERRGEPVDRSDMFGDCINMLDQTLIWKSTDGGKFDRLEIFIGPYEAGPYAEGSYVLNLPITAPMVAAIAPVYRDNFSVSGGNPFAVED